MSIPPEKKYHRNLSVSGHKIFCIFHHRTEGGRALILLWYFVLYSFLGFLLEVAFARVTRHPKKDRKCFLLLPLCPVYGLGAILIHWLSGLLEGPLWVMAAGFVGATAAELGMGLFYRYLLRVDFWDYSGLALVTVYGLDRLILPLTQQIPAALDAPALILLAVDGAVSAFALRMTGSTEVLRWYR